MWDKILSFPYTGVLFNAAIVLLGGLIGLLFRRGFPKRLTDALMIGMGLCVIYIGLSGAISAGADAEASPMIPVLSIALGAVIGTLCNIDGTVARLGKAVERRFSRGGEGSGLAEGFVSASLLFCIGSMTVIGAINAGVSGDNTVYFTKGMIDFVSGVALTVSLGAGVLLSSVSILAVQGVLVLVAALIEPYLTHHMIMEVNCTGSLLILAIGLNLIGITKIKVADYLPAVPLALLFAILL